MWRGRQDAGLAGETPANCNAGETPAVCVAGETPAVCVAGETPAVRNPESPVVLKQEDQYVIRVAAF
jgi:hypothetical protein